jgi:NAD(P)-dependent dehydrogenase (short-subunit alcohol dehydrogenase family)
MMVMAVFRDKVVLVTGASEGIGRAICRALAPQQPKLVIAARNRERLESLKEEVEAGGAEALVCPADVTSQEECRAIAEKAVERFGGIDILINNAGGTMWCRFDAITDIAIFERLMRLNCLSCVYLTHAALPWLKKSRGRIACVSSVSGLAGVPERSAYAASKHAVFGFFDSLRIELASSGVSVTMIAPDFVLSEVHRRALGPDGAPLGESPMQEDRIMTAEACAALIVPAIAARRRLLITSARGRAGYRLKPFVPGLLDRIAAKAIRDRK